VTCANYVINFDIQTMELEKSEALKTQSSDIVMGALSLCSWENEFKDINARKEVNFLLLGSLEYRLRN
jgi:hypothetical protein